MKIHIIKVEKNSGDLKREEQFAWKIAELAISAKYSDLDDDVIDMVKNRIIDNAAISLAAINEHAVVVARNKALATKGNGSATIYGMPNDETFGVSEAAFVNAVSVRFRDQDDTYLAAEYSHPDDNISPILAVAQQVGGVSGKDLILGIATAYEVHVALVGTGNGTGICLHKHKVDHMPHIAAATAAGIGAMLKLPIEEIYHAINFAVHNSISSRQSRKGDIGSQKEFVPGFSAEISIDAVNFAMLGLKGPNPVYEGVDSIISRFLDGENAEYKLELAEAGTDKLRNIMRTYPKEHAFEYQGQAIIDMSLEMINKMPKKDNGTVDWSKVDKILLVTSHHTDHVIGTGANDPQKIDPNSPRGTLDHSIMFAIARSMQLGKWNEDVYNITTDEEKEELRLAMLKISTEQSEEWERRYHSTDPNEQSFGGTMIVTLKDGSKIEDSKSCANAHPLGSNPWKRDDYIGKLEKLTKDIISDKLREAFLKIVDGLENISSETFASLTPTVDLIELEKVKARGIYNTNYLDSSKKEKCA